MDCGNQICSRTAFYGIGRCYSCNSKYRLSQSNQFGKNNPNWKNRIIKVNCEICNKSFTRKISNILNHIFCSQVCYNKHKSDRMIGIKNINYKHGEGNFPYPLEFNYNLKQEIRERDNFICKSCGINEKLHLKLFNEKLSIHHLDFNKSNCKKNNLITVCRKCNTKLNFNLSLNEHLKSCMKI